MSSPQRIQIELESQIKKRINHHSPTKYDIDFYLRKISRLQDDFETVQEELGRARVRLRRAEDYQIKYDLISKQISQEKQQSQTKQREICQLKSQNEQLKVALQQKSTKTEDWSELRLNFQQEIEKWKIKYQDLQEKKMTEVVNNKEQSNTIIQKEIQIINRSYIHKEQNYQEQIRQLRKTLQEKKTVEGVISNRVDKVRKDKDEEINRLREFIKNQKSSSNQAIREKSEEIDHLREKFQKMFNFELEGLRKNMEDQDQVFNIEVNGLREMISLKNDEVIKLLAEIKKISQNYQYERQQLNDTIVSMREKIYSIQRENQLELFNTIERITKIHAEEIQSLQKLHAKEVQNLKNGCIQLQILLKQREKILQNQRAEVDRVRADLHDRLRQRDVKINELKQNIKQSGDINNRQMNNLHQSFHKIQSQKQILTGEYQMNVGFLNQQIAKLTGSNQMKNQQIMQLQDQINKVKKESTATAREIQAKWREDRKKKDEERDKQRQLRGELEEKYREQESLWKIKQRQLERDREREERQKNKVKFILEESQRDIQRLNQYIKNLDENLKKQQKQSQLNIIDNGGIRRELSAELDRQTIQLEAIKKIQMDQLRKKHEIEITHLTNQLQKLRTDQLSKSIAYQQLKQQFKKLEHINRNIDKINKQKLLQYQKKMATLNNEINLTQNLYQSFLRSKSKVDTTI